AVPRLEVAVLLVRERLDRGGVDDAAAVGEGLLDRVFGDHGLAGAGRRRDEDRAAGVDGSERLLLEGVELECAVLQRWRLRLRRALRIFEPTHACGPTLAAAGWRAR